MKLLGLLCVALMTASISADDDIEINIKQGKLRGHRLLTRYGKAFRAFQGIPYGKPPIGELRFKRSEPADGWTGVFDATKEGAECTQKDIFVHATEVQGTEDCLFINVYTPQDRNDSLRPVMVWIHGGGWLSGSGTTYYYGGNFLLDKDVVYVNFNYRLGPLGFLSTGDDVCPGNNGLKDQVLALRWVKNNIAQFKGDPTKVTIFGQSAGGASVHLHTLSPLSKGLFHGAIAHSGNALASWAFASRHVAADLVRTLSILLDCPTVTSGHMIDCLRKKEASDITNMGDMREWNQDPLVIFRPVKESGNDAFLTDEPIVLLQDPDSIAKVPFITGGTSGEGGLFCTSVFYNQHLLKEYSDNFESIAPISLMYRETSPDPDDYTRRIKEFYLSNKPITQDMRYQVVDMYTDIEIVQPATQSARLHADASVAPVYYYYFDYMPPVSYTTLDGDFSGIDFGVSHNDELQFLFPHDEVLPQGALTSQRDLHMSELMVTMWTNFAKTGNPTPGNDPHVQWSPVSSSSVEYLNFGRNGDVTMNHSLLARRADFWASLPLSRTNQILTNQRDEL